MRNTFIVILTVLSLSNIFAQRKQATNVQLKAIGSFETMGEIEKNVIHHHKLMNLAYELILSDDINSGLDLLKNASSNKYHSFAIDVFFKGFAYALLYEKEVFSEFLEQAIDMDSSMLALIQSPQLSRLFSSVMGEKKWTELLNKKRTLKNGRIDQDLISKMQEIDSLDHNVVELEQILKDSIRIHHPNDQALIRTYQARILSSKLDRDEVFNSVILSEAWPMNRLRLVGLQNYYLDYVEQSDWFEKSASRFEIMLLDGVIFPWEYAFMHDWHARKTGQAQKYALFYGQSITENVIRNCEEIGMPVGAVRDIRVFHKAPQIQ